MYNFLSKNGQLIAFGLGALLTVVFLLIVFSGAEDFSLLSKSEQMETTIFNFGLGSAIALTAICAVAALLFGLIFMILNLKNSLRAIIGIIAIVVIFVIGYSVADPNSSGSLGQTILEFGVQDGASKFISGAMITTGVLGAIAIAGLILFEIYNLIK